MSKPLAPFLTISLLLLLLHIPSTKPHGFLTTPRSRNLVAYQDRIYYPQTANDPLPEDCPSCLNRGGSLARCGIIGQRNYDLPQNALGGPMKSNPQGVYIENSEINITVTLTAHHKGHFVFSACPIENTTTVPSQECFDSHKLTFVKDLLYGAPVDVNHPERVYVAPSTVPTRVNPTQEEFTEAMLFMYTLKLPQGLVGELVLLQWYYVASNSGCVHEGYDEYPFPRSWIASLKENDGQGDVSDGNDDDESHEPSDWEAKWSVGTGLKSCAEVLPEDGDGLPEQFWNCAEITIKSKPSANTVAPLAQNKHSKAILGYYASWQWYDRDKLASPENMDFRKVSRVNFAFFQTNVDGDIWGTDSWADPNLLFGPYNWNPAPNETEHCSWDTPTSKVCKTHFYEQGLVHLVHAAGAEIYPSLGGWSLSDPFPAMAANEKSRTQFANKCIELVEEYNFDGIDIDWEYPGYTDHSGTPEDTVSYNLLLQVLREKLDELGTRNNRFYGLTAALPCGPSNINNIDIKTASKYLTELNLMTYDFFGAWSPTTGVNAPLFDQNWGGEGAKDFSVDGCVRNWIKGGGSPSAINIGLPFYGRSFVKAKALNETHEGNDKNNWFVDDGSPQYFNIVNKLSGMVSVRNELTKTQFAYFNTTMGGVVSYDDEEAICDKAEYCLEHELHGFIIWELSGDVMPDLSTPLLDAVHRKLNDPSLPCKDTFVYDPSTFSGYSIGEALTIPAGPEAPKPAPTTMSPTVPLSCPNGFTGSLPKDACHEFYTCILGNPIYPSRKCPDGTLFDEASTLCLPSFSVECSLTRSPTTAPTQEPTNHPSVYVKLGEDSIGSIMEVNRVPQSSFIGEGHVEDHQFTYSSIPTRRVTTPSFVYTLPQDASQQDNVSPYDSVDLIKEEDEENQTVDVKANQDEDVGYLGSTSYCPSEFSGARPYNNCTEYYYCLTGRPLFPAIKCPPGLFFAEALSLDKLISCSHQSQEECLLVSNPANDTLTIEKSPANSEGDILINIEKGNESSIEIGAPNKLEINEQSPDNIEQESVQNIQHKSPCKACPKDYTGYKASTMDCVSFCLCEKGVISNVLHVCPSDWLFDDEQGRCLPSGQVNCGFSDNLLNNGETEEFIAIDESDISEGLELDAEQKHEPPTFSFESPFLTLEIKLGHNLSGIGWSVQASDGTLNVDKPPGTYTSFKPRNTVYEAIPIAKIGKGQSTTMDSNRSHQKLTVTISNTLGTGLCCSGEKNGYYKIYSGNPTVDSLVAMGGKFEYFDVIPLILAEDGTLHVSDTYFASLENDDETNLASTGEGNDVSDTPFDIQPSDFGTDATKLPISESSQQQQVVIVDGITGSQSSSQSEASSQSGSSSQSAADSLSSSLSDSSSQSGSGSADQHSFSPIDTSDHSLSDELFVAPPDDGNLGVDKVFSDSPSISQQEQAVEQIDPSEHFPYEEELLQHPEEGGIGSNEVPDSPPDTIQTVQNLNSPDSLGTTQEQQQPGSHSDSTIDNGLGVSINSSEEEIEVLSNLKVDLQEYPPSTQSLDTQLKQDGSNKKTPQKSIIIGSICVAFALSVCFLLIVHRRKSYRDWTYFQDYDSSVCSDDFIEDENHIDVETAYQVRSIHSISSSSSESESGYSAHSDSSSESERERHFL